MNFNRAGDQAVRAYTYHNLTISGGGTKTLQGATTVHSLSVGAATTLVTQQHTLTGNAGGVFTMADGATLRLGLPGNAANVFPANFTAANTTLHPNSTVVYQAGGAQSVLAATYGHLVIDGGNIKTIQGPARVNSSLTLADGNLSTGSGANNLTLGPTATLSATGGFGPTRMVQCDGTGLLVVEGTSPARFAMIYPVGTAGAFTPMEITGFSGTVAGPGSVGVRVAATTAPGANPTDLRRHWVTTGINLGAISANVRFTYLPGDISPTGNGAEYQAWFHDGASWSEPLVRTAAGVNPFGADGVGSLSGTWTAREPIVTLYAYQSGPWNVATTWTTDPSGTLSVSPAVPSAFDRVVILNGRTVTTPTGGIAVLSLQLNEGGTLSLGTTTGHSFGTVTGQGLLRLATSTFPAGDFAQFVAANGGTVEYLNTADFSFTQFTYNHLVINCNALATTATVVGGDLTVNGNLTVRRGTFRINDNTATAERLITVQGDVLVEPNGRIRVGTGVLGTAFADRHRLVIRGNFTNHGDVQFTNLTVPNYTAWPNHRVEVIFDNPSAHQYVQLNGPTRFYRIEIDKGVDQTHILNIDATSAANFTLFGRNDQQPTIPLETPPNLPNQNALGLLAGTVRLGSNILIPCLGTDSGSNGVFNIDEDAGLWLDGATVVWNPTMQNLAPVVYGLLRISGTSYFDLRNANNGIVMRTTSSVIVEGGQMDATIFRVSSQDGIGTHRGSYNQTGGVVNVTGNVHTALGFSASFMMPYTAQSFTMSGGTLNILSSTTTSGSGNNFSFIVNADPNNVNVTGGTVNITVPPGRAANINSTIPFWNLNIISGTGTSNLAGYAGNATLPAVPAIPARPLVVQNDFSVMNTVTFNANSLDVTVGGNFTLAAGATYTPGANTTTLNGAGPQAFSNLGTITTGLNHLVLSNRADVTIGANLALRGNLTIGSGTTLRDNTRTITVAGSVSNSGTHFRPAGAAGRIELTGTAAQTVGGDGQGVFNNLAINKTGGSVDLTAATTVLGELRLATDHRLNIGAHRLGLGPEAAVYSALTGTAQAFSAARMIRTNGLASDGGVVKTFSSTDELLLPFGLQSGATHLYLPARVQFAQAPAQWGSVALRPVLGRHHLAQGANNALGAYWKVASSGFTGIPAGSVTLRFQYTDGLVQGVEAQYRAAVYPNGTTWDMLADPTLVDPVANTITFPLQPGAHGDYTAGMADAFGSIPVLYSSASGSWTSPATWSATAVGGPGGAGTPGPNTIVVIGSPAHSHTITIPADGQQAGALFIAAGATLDLGTTQGHNFAAIPEEAVTGGGTLRIARSGYFPRGDFGDFIGPNGGTVEYYTSGSDVTIPVTSDGTGLPLNQYHNLVLTHSGANSVILPNTDLTIHRNLTVNGAGTGQARTNTTAARTVSVLGNLVVASGTLQYRNAVATTIRALGDVSVAGGASFTVLDGGTAVDNILELHGNLNNDGTFNMVGGTRRAITRFVGASNTAIAGAGPTYNFFRVEVNRGVDPTFAVHLTSAITTTGGASPFLVLQNGTFRVDNPALDVIFTTADFTIPATAALSVINGTARVAHGGGNLLLAGRLEVLGGRMFIGNPAQDQSNSIEYAAAGRPEIVVRGGELNVNGQIRRATTITSGALSYTQSGGVVTILGRQRAGALPSRGLLEITNTNSHLAMSGGTLRFDRPSAAGTTFGDILLRPHTHAVEGGALQVGLPASTAGFTFRLSSSAPLWSVVVGDGTDQVLRNEVLPLTVQGDLTINGSSQLLANGLDLTLGGNLRNFNTTATAGMGFGGFLAGAPTQTVTLNGSGVQQVAGSGANLTNFANLTVATTGTVELQPSSNLRVNGNLAIESGVLHDGAQTISVVGSITNNATHTSPTAAGGIALVGGLNQNILGTDGQLGNLIMSNPMGATLHSNTTINGRLTFTLGSLYIDDYLLTLGPNATIGGDPNRTRMILLNGVLSDRGVSKHFPAGPSASFTFPIGVSGKYTPATFQIVSANQPGTIRIRPVNRRHPAVVGYTVDNELAYYWSVDTTGFNGVVAHHTYHYLQDDVREAGSVTEAQYVVGRYRTHAYQWANLGDAGAPGQVNEAANTITITSANFIYGEYTAGSGPDFTPPFDIYYSRISGSWTDPSSWSLVSHTGPPATTAPVGNPVVIASGHTINLNADGQFSASVEVNGVLDVGTTVFHNLGSVFGTGTIEIGSTPAGYFVFPGGSFDEFFDTPGTTVVFKGANNATLPDNPGTLYKPFQHVVFRGAGVKSMTAEHMRVMGNLTIESGATLDNPHSKNIHLHGNWVNQNTSANGFVPRLGHVIIRGNTPQLMDVRVTERFHNLVMNNTGGGLTLSGAAGIEIAHRLTLARGHIFAHPGREVTLTHTSPTAAVSGGSALSFVDGPLRKNILNGQGFNFPVGNAGRLGRIELIGASGATPSPALWTARYVNAHPATGGFPTDPATNLTTPLTTVSDNEYWVVTAPAGTPSANIRLRWDATSMPSHTGSPTLRPLLRVVEWDGAPTSRWTERGQTVSGTPTAGTVTTTTPVTPNDFVFTLGAIGISAAIADLTPRTICDNGQVATIPVNLTGTPPWALSYRTTGAGGLVRNFTETGITTTPYNINLTGADMGGAAAGPFTLALVSVTASGMAGVVNPATVTINVQQTHQPSIVGPAAVGINQTRAYATPQNTGSTYAWVWVGASGGTIATPTAHSTNVVFGASTGTFTLRVTETSSTGCQASHQVDIAVLNVPAPDITPKAGNLCVGATETYSTASIPGNEYLWTVTNGSCTGCGVWGTSSSIVVVWGATGSTSITVQERIAASPTIIGTATESYFVHPMPSAFAVTAPAPVCAGGSASIVVASEVGITYQLRLHPGNTPVGAPVAGTGGSISLPTGPLSATTTFNVRAYNLGCERVSAPVTAPVAPLPTLTMAVVAGATVCDGDPAQLQITYTVGTPSFTLTVSDDHGWSQSLDQTVVIGSPHILIAHPTWDASALPVSPSTLYRYTAVMVDANGCASAPMAAPAEVTVWKIPETGPQLHVPNTHAP